MEKITELKSLRIHTVVPSPENQVCREWTWKSGFRKESEDHTELSEFCSVDIIFSCS